MTYTINYRDASGARAQREIEAPDRKSAFEQAAKLGISVIQLDEGPAKKAKKTRKSASGGAPKMSRGIAAGLVVVLALGGVLYLVSHKEEAKPTPAKKKVEKIAEVAPAKIVKRDAQENLKVEPELPPSERIVEMISVRTNENGSVLERFRTADGKIRSRQSAPKAIFEYATDHLIAMAVCGAESGHAMPPMPVNSNADDEFAESLKKDIVINADDPEDVKRIKQVVRETRETVKQLMAEGRSFNEIIANHQELVNGNVQLREEALKAAQKLVDEGDKESAEVYVNAANEVLRNAGAEEVDVPLTREEHRELIRQRHKERDLEAK